MLRRALMVFGCCLLAGGGALLILARNPVGLALFFNGCVLIAALAFERSRYKPTLASPPGPGWQPTGEKSADRRGVVSVWFNPANGARAYVREAGSPPAP
jgi:hypothetical protein